MYSVEKCASREGSGDGCEMYAGGGEGMGQGVAADEVASAVAAASDEIGEILKDELGDADRADRIGAELADLSAELGLLAGLADGEGAPNFAPRFEGDFEFEWIGITERVDADSSSSSSSSVWSGGRPVRPPRVPRRRPIAKGKEMSRLRNIAARRAACLRVRRAEVVSDASDVGADSDSGDQWTELDSDQSVSGSESSSDKAAANDCNGYQHNAGPEPPGMGQYLLPLLSAEPTSEGEHVMIRHEEILQLLASADDVPLGEAECSTAHVEDDSAVTVSAAANTPEDDPLTPEDEVALLRYVCASEQPVEDESSESFTPVEEWLLGVYHSWCEISALMYTLIGTNVNVETVDEEWLYRARFGCHCRLCMCLANAAAPLARLIRHLVTALAHGEGTSQEAAYLVRALELKPDGANCEFARWDIARLKNVPFTEQGASIIHEQLTQLASESDMSRQIVQTVCLCRVLQCPMDQTHAVQRLCYILETFKAASNIVFKVDMIPVDGGTESPWAGACGARLAKALAPHQRCSTAQRLSSMRARTASHHLSAWSGYKHRCDCLTPRTLNSQQRRQLLRISFFGMMQAVNEANGSTEKDNPSSGEPPSSGENPKAVTAKDPDVNDQAELEKAECSNKPPDGPHHDTTNSISDESTTETESECGSGSLGLSSSSSLDSASELLLAACAAVDSTGSDDGAAPQELCRTVRHLMRSIASIERLMDKVLEHCDEWVVVYPNADQEARKRVDIGLSEVDRKLMAMYRRLPEVHRRQLQVYRKQKKLSTVCMQLVGGSAPLPPPPGSPPPAPAPPPPPHAAAPKPTDYHLQHITEVRRKVMHMRDQQLYYHRLRLWLEERLNNGDGVTDSKVTIEDMPRRRRTSSPKHRLTGSKRKLKPTAISKPHKILQMLRHKAPGNTAKLLSELNDEVTPPEAFAIDKDSDLSDTDTVVGDKDPDLCKDMKECLAKFASFALNEKDETKFPEAVSPPLQEMSPTEPVPVYTPKPSQRLLTNKLLTRKDDTDNAKDLTNILPDVLNVNAPLNARRTPVLVKEENPKEIIEELKKQSLELLEESKKDANFHKYVTFGHEIKKAMEECQNIINTYNSINDTEKPDGDEQFSLEQICDVMTSLDKNYKLDTAAFMDAGANTKIAELVENMPQILANMPEIASKLSEFANASIELPEFASIMNSLPDANNEAQLTPETLKQIRELKLSKNRDNVKVTKNTAKRKSNRRIKGNRANDYFIELHNKEISEILKDDKEIEALMKSESPNKGELKDLVLSLSTHGVFNKVFQFLKQNNSPEVAEYLEDGKGALSLPIDDPNTEMYEKATTLFDNSVKDAQSMDELRELVRSRFNLWKQYVLAKFKTMPIDLLESEIEGMLGKFYSYIKDLASKQCTNETDKILDKIDDIRKRKSADYKDSDEETCPYKQSVNKMSKILSTTNASTFDSIIMKLSKMSKAKRRLVEGLRFKYMDVITRCTVSQQLIDWILIDPEISASVIQELTGLPINKTECTPDFTGMSNETKSDYFCDRLAGMNRQYLNSLPKDDLTGDEWLVILYMMEQIETKLKEFLAKATPPRDPNKASEAEILVAKGLSKMIAKSNVKVVVKPKETAKKEELPNSPKTETKEETEEDKKSKNEALLARCEAILVSKGEKSLLENFHTIKSYISQGIPVPATYKKHVINICSSIDAKLLDDDIEETLKDLPEIDNKDNISVIGSQNPELLAKYSAQALRNAKHTLNAVAFKNMMKNGQSKSESDACDTPKSECKWTNDCICNTCKNNEPVCKTCKSNDPSSVCLGDIVKQCYDADGKTKTVLEDKNVKEQVNKQPKPALKAQLKVQPKSCENQHVCKVGHTPPTSGSCAGDSASDQPCTCCYCTVFGHAPPLTTPVPRNFNETRERLRSILNKKKQKYKTNGEQETEKKPATPAPRPVDSQPPKQPVQQPPVIQQPQPKPPALPKCLPPSLPSQPTTRRLSVDQQKLITEQMAKITLAQDTIDNANNKVPQLARSPQVHVNVNSTSAANINTEGKVNANAMEQIRIQQRKLQQQAQLQSQMQQEQIQQQHAQHLQQQIRQQQQHQQPNQQTQQHKPEPIYDLPIHNKPTLTPEQQQQIRLQQQQLQQQQLQQQQLQQQQLQQQQLLQQKQQQQHKQDVQIQQQLLQQQEQQRASRPQQERALSLSSRDTSVFSTSSGCDGDLCWQRSRPEDPRDLDALLQYIEGPARHVDRGKKKAKKQRQKAKKMEQKLEEERASLATELFEMKHEMAAMRVAHSAANRRVEEVRKLLQHHQKIKKKGKKTKLDPCLQAKVDEMAEQLGELTTLLHTASKEVIESEKQANDCSRRLQQCEKELMEARVMLGKPVQTPAELAYIKQQLIQEKFQNQQLHHQKVQIQKMIEKQQQGLHEEKLQKQEIAQMMEQVIQRFPASHPQPQVRAAPIVDRQKQAAIINATSASGIVRVRRMPCDGTVTLSYGPRETPAPLAPLLHHNQLANSRDESKPEKKQTWEQALAHMNQLAKGQAKDKKKQKEKEAKAAVAAQKAKETQRSQSLPDATQELSKKQRKALAKQQAEEEERRRQEEQAKQEAKAKKEAKKAEKKADAKKAEPVKKAEDKKEVKKEKAQEKKGKENKQEKSVQREKQPKQPPPQPQPQPQQMQQTKKDKKKQKQPQTPQHVNEPRRPMSNPTMSNTNHMSNHVPMAHPNHMSHQNSMSNLAPMSNLPPVSNDGKPASCSIMEQLSCGVNVADLRLPPGITLTRVQACEKKEPVAIKSVPLWCSNQLVSAPTPVARPVPVINADPSTMTFTNAQPEQPKPAQAPFQGPPPAKSKKSKKKAKKSAPVDEPKPDATKMVTLRNPMFHPNLPPVQVGAAGNTVQKKAEQIRIPDPIPMPPTPCQATITPTSNGMYTIRNPLMSMMHQQQQMPPPSYGQQFNYANPNVYVPVPPNNFEQARMSPKQDEFQSRIMNLASFTQKNDEGYSLFSTPEENQHAMNQRNFLGPDYYDNQMSKPTVSPNPIGTRPLELNRSFDSDTSLFANPIQRPEPIGPPMKRDDVYGGASDAGDYSSLYTPFGQEERNVFRNALFSSDRNAAGCDHELQQNGDPLPYFQRLRVGAKLNSEVTIHHVTDSKMYRQEPQMPEPSHRDASIFARNAWNESAYNSNNMAPMNMSEVPLERASQPDEEPNYGPVGARHGGGRPASTYL